MKIIERTFGFLLLWVMLFCVFGTRARAQQTTPPTAPPRPDWSAPASQAPEAQKPSPAGGNQQDGTQAGQNKTPSIVSTTGLVHLVATVTDRRHNFVTDLEQSDFKILEDNTPQDIRFFGRETDLL